MADDQKKEILGQILDFISYVYDQQTQSSQPVETNKQNSQNSQEAFGVWRPK